METKSKTMCSFSSPPEFGFFGWYRDDENQDKVTIRGNSFIPVVVFSGVYEGSSCEFTLSELESILKEFRTYIEEFKKEKSINT